MQYRRIRSILGVKGRDRISKAMKDVEIEDHDKRSTSLKLDVSLAMWRERRTIVRSKCIPTDSHGQEREERKFSFQVNSL